jgi:hypothetical protein
MTLPIAGLSSASPYLNDAEITAEAAGGNAVASTAGAEIAPAATVVETSIGEGGTEGAVGSIGPEFGLPGTQLGGLGSTIGGTEGENGDIPSGGGLPGGSGSGNSGGVRLGGWGYAADNPDGDGGGSDVTFSDGEGSTFSNNGDGTVSNSDVTFSDAEGSTFWNNGDGTVLGGGDGTTSDVTFSDKEAGAMTNFGDGYIDQMGSSSNGGAGEDAVGQFFLNVTNGIGTAIATGEEIGKAILSELGGAAVEKVFGSSEGNPPKSGPGAPADGGSIIGPGPLEYPVPDGGGPMGPASTLFMPTPDGGGPMGPASTLSMPTPEGTGPTGPASMPELGLLRLK